jgi:SAM-dependent methyltransferase
MVVSERLDASLPGSSGAAFPDAASREVTWHDLECGAYRADLGLWRELGRTVCGDPPCPRILDVGAGTGRVTLDLARAGHGVTALELRPALLDALRRRAAQLDVETEQADARDFELGRRDFGLCIVPMNTIQLLTGPAARSAFLARARAHLRPGGLLACTIISEPETFDTAHGDREPSPETVQVGGLTYVSRTTRVSVRRGSIVIALERQILLPEDTTATKTSLSPAPGRSGGEGSARQPPAEREVITLDRVGISRLEREGIAAGLRVEPARRIPPTDEHAGSAVVMLRA